MTGAATSARPALTGSARAGVAAAREVHRAAAPWPYATLDVPAARRDGWRPAPVHDIVLKIHQRCNLACDYCYVYETVDQSWRDRPAAMPQDVWEAAVDAIGRHTRTHGSRGVRVILHGGEPLLFGTERIGALTTRLRAAVPDTCAVEVGMQTNGVLLTERRLAALGPHGITFGVSIDGVPEVHDAHRVTRSGRGSFAAAARALDLLRRPEHRASYAGILCTVSAGTDPIACYEQLLAFDPPTVDLLLPHANWQHPPQRPHDAATPYADWLIAVFDRWYSGGETRIRLFEDVISLLLGGGSRSEQIGLSPAAVVVIESDGAIEQVDALKSAYSGACATGLDIRHDELDSVLDDPGIIARQLGPAALSDTCRACPVHRVCGAGHYAHRFRPGQGFHNPSVYCADLRRLIEHVHGRLSEDVRRRVAGQVTGAS